MPDLALHFVVPADADPAAVAAAFQQQLAAVPDVDAVTVRADQQRSVGPQEITVFLTTASALMGTSVVAIEATTKLIAALRKLVAEAGELGHALGLRHGRLESGMDQVPLDKVSDDTLKEAAQS